MELLIILILIILNGLFSMSEISIVSARKSRLDTSAKKGDVRAARALALAENPNRFLSTVQVGITLIGILTGIFSGEKLTDDVAAFLNRFEVLQPYSESIAIVLVLIFITFLSLVIGELLPKRIGLNRAEGIAKSVAAPMNMLSRAMAPFIWLLGATTDLLIRLLGIKKSSDSQVTEEEIRAIIQEGTSAGAIEEIEQDIVENVFLLGERTVSSLMTQRPDIVWLNVHDSPEQLRAEILQWPYKLYPVCDHDLDQVLGVIFTKDIARELLAGRELNIRSLLRAPVYLPTSTRAYKALEQMRLQKNSVGLVINEYGGVQGLLTVNDIVDTLVVNLEQELHLQQEIVPRPDGSYLVEAALPMHEFCRYFEIELPEEQDASYHTIGGLILHHARSLPPVGYTMEWHGLQLEVIDLDGMRIDKILLRYLPD